uniref:Uncharacterized protein n=1 Tax=Anguilla anguilla TaxID=7936 RepID=A0A0E9TMY2_ANGAN
MKLRVFFLNLVFISTVPTMSI